MPAKEPAFNVRAYYWAFAILSAIGLLAPLRAGDLPGYDDAQYSNIAREIVRSGDWLNLHINGLVYMQHPPMLEWMQASLFSVFHRSDAMAKLPAGLCGLGTILLTYWLGRRIAGDSLRGLLAMFVMATSAYFVKYSAHAMNDVPVTFFFLAAICAWLRTGEHPAWYLASGALTGIALMTRALTGFGIPAIIAIQLLIQRRERPPIPYRYAATGLALAILPLAAWNARAIYLHRDLYFAAHSAWLALEVYAPLSPAWRRYTGFFEYFWMLAKSYWPWLPFAILGAAAVTRGRNRRLALPIVWVGVVFFMYGLVSSRVLRYVLPAYPALAVLAATGLATVVPLRYLRNGIRILTPVLGTAVIAIAIFPPAAQHAADIRPVAAAAASVTQPAQRIAFYDAGPPRYDETNQLAWYAARDVTMLFSSGELTSAIAGRRLKVFIVDRNSYRAWFGSKTPNEIIAESGHLICVSLR